MKHSNVIALGHPACMHVVILDANDKLLNKVISYDIVTKEAEVYDTNEDGTVKTEWETDIHSFEKGGTKRLVTKKVTLEGSRLAFKVYPEQLEGIAEKAAENV